LDKFLTDEARHPENGAFHAFGAQPDFRQFGNHAGAHALSIVEPEDQKVSLLVPAGTGTHEALLDLAKQDRLLNDFPGIYRLGFSLEFRVELLHVAAAVLVREEGSEVIVGKIDGYCLYIANNGCFRVSNYEFKQETALAGIKFKERFLNEVVYYFPASLPPVVGSSNDRHADCLAKP
jgi:hypothetical protein